MGVRAAALSAGSCAELRDAIAEDTRGRWPGPDHHSIARYLIRVNAGELDVSSFEDLLRIARSEARDGCWDRAASHAREALKPWRGEPLADVDCEVLAAREVPRLAELRLQALETRIDADLHMG